MSNQRLFITGANGFLGNAVLRHCLQDAVSVAAYARRPPPPLWNPSTPWFTGSLSDAPELIRRLREFDPTYVVHCAGAASVPFSTLNPAEDFRNSTDLLLNVLEAMRHAGTESKLVLLSTAAVYGNPAALPVSESDPAKPVSPYGATRHINEMLFRSYADFYGIDGYIVRIFSAYGPGLRKQVIYDGILKLAFGTAEICMFHGTGFETRDFIYSEDIARAILFLCRADAQGVFNLAGGSEVRICDLLETIKRTVGSNRTVAFSGDTRYGDPLHWLADTSRLTQLGFSPSVSLDAGLGNVWQWIQSTTTLSRD